METNKIITAEYFPDIPRTEIARRSKFKYSLSELSGLGGGFAVAAAAVADAAMNQTSTEGLYRCVFPDGVTGKLASFKDGTGYLGTIMGQNGIAGQARWIPAEASSVGVAVDPVTLAVAVAVMSVNKKLDSIQKTQAEILRFLHQDKESKLEGSVNILADILEQYQFNSDKALWKIGKLTAVTAIKGTAEENIIFYRKEIMNNLDKQKSLHDYRTADKLQSDLESNFKYYQLSLYLYAYASFEEVLLGDNYDSNYLERMSRKIRENAIQYKIDYTTCYDELEAYMKGSIEAVALSGIGNVGKAMGKKMAQIPLINKGSVDEALIAGGNKLKKLGSRHGKRAMSSFSDNQDVEIHLFLHNIETINEMSNQCTEILFDRDNIYICEDNYLI